MSDQIEIPHNGDNYSWFIDKEAKILMLDNSCCGCLFEPITIKDLETMVESLREALND